MVPVCHRKYSAIEMNMVLLAYLLEMKRKKKKENESGIGNKRSSLILRRVGQLLRLLRSYGIEVSNKKRFSGRSSSLYIVCILITLIIVVIFLWLDKEKQ